MKIAIIADIHHGPARYLQSPDWEVLRGLEEFVVHANTVGADVLLDLGDRINEVDADPDRRRTTEIQSVLSEFKGPRLHLMGNHDAASLSGAEIAEILGCSFEHQVHEFPECRIVCWQPSVDIELGAGYNFAQSDLDWLTRALQADERPAIIATHVPFSGQPQVGNYYFENSPAYAAYQHAAEARAAVERTGVAAMWLAGHVHWNTLTNIRGIWHATFQSLRERHTTFPEVAGAYAFLTITREQAEIEVHGNDPFFARVPFKRSDVIDWQTPHPPFAGIDPH